MERYARSHLADQTLLSQLATHLARERGATAEFLADLAEVDERKLYVPAGYPSLHAYCVGALHLSEQAAFKRILAARTARRFPAIFAALAEGRLHLAAVVLLAPHLSEATAEELLAAATYKTKSEVEQLLAARFPRPDVLPWVAAVPTAPGTCTAEPQAGPVEDQLSPGIVEPQPGPGFVSAQRVAVQLTLSQSEYEELCYAQALLGHQVRSGDVGKVVAKAVKAFIPQLERRKFAATKRPGAGRKRSGVRTRHIPADVKRAVWERDGGQCTYVSESGQRCPARKFLQFDHREAFARGGEATVSGIRLLCQAHNQYEAERTFGAEFMRQKRLAAAEARAAAKARAEAEAREGAAAAAREQAAAAERAKERDVVPWLRALGFSAWEARRAAERCAHIPDAPIEERVRVALSSVHVLGTRYTPAVAAPGAPARLTSAAPG